MRRPTLPLAAAALCSLLAACDRPFLYAELTIPELRVNLPQQDFPASSGAPPDQWCTPTDPSCLFTEVEYDFSDAVPLVGEKGVTVDLRLTEISMALDAGTSDFGTVESVTIRIVSPDDPADSVVAASYVRTEPNPTTITVSGNANIDLGPYLSGSKFVARAEMVYASSTPAFTADVSARFSLVLTVDYGSYVF